MDVSERLQAWSLNTVFVSSDERQHLHADSEPDVWRRDKWLGSGGFGDVFKEICVDGPRRRQIRAVKRVRKSPTAMRLVQRELDVLVDFATDNNKHESREHFVRFLGWFGDNTHFYVAMELVPFGDLQSHTSNKPCSEKDTALIIGQVGRALQYMHEKNVVHRDLKPANILVARPSPDWHVKLTDFGISKNLDNTELQTRVGTEAYMAPELFEQKDASTKYTSAVDVWSLGAVAFNVRTGKAPFENTFELCKFSSGTMRIPTQPLMKSSGAFIDFILSLMEKSPASRLTMTGVLEHGWMKSAGHFSSAIGDNSTYGTSHDWDAQASAIWDSNAPQISDTSTEPDQATSQDDIAESVDSVAWGHSRTGGSARSGQSTSPDFSSPASKRSSSPRQRILESVQRKPLPANLKLEHTYYPDRVRTPRWDKPGWLHGDGDNVMVSVPYHIDNLDLMMDFSSDLTKTCNTLSLYWHSTSYDANTGAATTGFARLDPSTTNYLFTAESRSNQEVIKHLECQAFARAFALEFNSFEPHGPFIDFLITPFVQRSLGHIGKDWLRLEEYNYDRSGVFVKYNDNSGFVDNDEDDELNMAAQAFSHFSFDRSKGRFLVCNLQGNGDLFIDPVLHTLDPNRLPLDTNRGMQGFLDFFSTHRCNDICLSLGLRSTAEDLRNDSPNSKLRFRKRWPPQAFDIGCCSNPICGRMLRNGHRRPPETPQYLWCNQCRPQLESSVTWHVCQGLGPSHFLKLSEFFYGVQSLSKPTMCPEHREDLLNLRV